jgi:hypothetical protein
LLHSSQAGECPSHAAHDAAIVTYYFKMKPGQIKKSPGLSPPANYTDRATTACRRS